MRECYSGTCPACSGEIQIVHHRLEIPHFPDLLLVAIACDACGYRHTDTIILGEGDPVRWTVRVEGADDLAIRVVRSTMGTIEISGLHGRGPSHSRSSSRTPPGTACSSAKKPKRCSSIRAKPDTFLFYPGAGVNLK
ncbi:MAG: ZPR1-related zinc finger protein [Methanoculleus marisnigri]|uniref:ZPR1-related zinc finger protein n=1 Tax=Methanoculleus marisnigri TaxID=2198 RepID=A0A101ITM3_9EURY|nr:MAG: ZPR1-related zinc finger protein [Methanoculleus marisnigri]